MIDTICHTDQILALIVSQSFSEPGIHFFTPGKLPQQLAFMRHPVMTVIRISISAH